MLSKELENTLNETFRTARARRHEFITVEHLLLALLDDPPQLRCSMPAKWISTTCEAS